MSKIIGFFRRTDGRLFNDISTLKKFDTHKMDNVYFRMCCSECSADFVIKFSELRECSEEDSNGDRIYDYVCPNCKEKHAFVMNAVFIANSWCDEDGNFILENGEHFIKNKKLCRCMSEHYSELENKNFYYERYVESGMTRAEKDLKLLCKTDEYSSITQKDIPEVEETEDNIPQIDVEEFNIEYEENSEFDLSLEEFLQCMNFHKVHSECMKNPETGLHRFGSIGGGISKRYYINGEKRSIIMKCEHCHKKQDLSDNAVTCLTPEEIVKYIEQYKYNYPDKMSKVEYLRFKKFCEDRPNEEISIGFMGTGLGSLINVKSETTGEYADITDTDCW